jgi:hypothetical protein
MMRPQIPPNIALMTNAAGQLTPGLDCIASELPSQRINRTRHAKKVGHSQVRIRDFEVALKSSAATAKLPPSKRNAADF